MSVRLSFEFAGDRQVDRRLEGMRLAAVDARPAFDKMGDNLRAAERRQFRSEGGYGSGGWSPLSPAYRRWKSAHYPGRPILVRSEALLKSLTERPFGIDEVHPSFAIFGTNVEYAIYHQLGTNRMPRRPVIDLPESLRRRWVKILQRWLVEQRTDPAE